MGVTLEMTRAKAMMLSCGITCSELAGMAGVGRSNLSMLLNGHWRPHKAVAALVADALGWDGDPMRLFERIELEERC